MDDSGKMRTSWVDAAFAVHPDMKSNTGGCVISFGTGGIICKSSAQKVNTKSSTKAEFVVGAGPSDYLPNTLLWVKTMFLEAQVYPIEENFFEQDNESAIKLEMNGRMSAGQWSRLIDIQYFWTKDQANDAGGVSIRNCPILIMLADFLPKHYKESCSRNSEPSLWDRRHS